MNDPAVMAAANAAFSKMSEEQRRQMQEQVSRFTPEQIAQAQNMMNSMSPDQRAKMAEMAANATPEELLQRSQQAASMGAMPNMTAVSESDRLKGEGNVLVKEKRYEEASKKYVQALRTPGITLETKKAAHLNAALCFLNLEQHDDAIKHSSLVIKAIDASNMKAHYRRGQAYIHKKNKPRAVADLERALELCSESDRAAVEELLMVARAMEDVEVEEVEFEEVEFEEAVPETKPSVDAAFARVDSRSVPAASAAGMAPQMDPQSLRQAASMMEGMSDEQLESMLKMGGAPEGVSASQMRMATKMMSSMSAEDVKRMTDMAQKFQGGSGVDAPNVQDLAKDPDMVATMTNMMKNMDPVELASMMSTSGVKVTPDQAKMMSDTLSSMDEKTLARLAKAATFFGKMAALYQRAKLYMKKNPAMAVAILVLIIALILRWKGMM